MVAFAVEVLNAPIPISNMVEAEVSNTAIYVHVLVYIERICIRVVFSALAVQRLSTKYDVFTLSTYPILQDGRPWEGTRRW